MRVYFLYEGSIRKALYTVEMYGSKIKYKINIVDRELIETVNKIIIVFDINSKEYHWKAKGEYCNTRHKIANEICEKLN